MISIVNRCQPATDPEAKLPCLLKSLLDSINVPVAVLRHDRSLVHANTAGMNFIQGGNVLKLHAGVIHAMGDACALTQFDEAVRTATPSRAEKPGASMITLNDGDGTPVLVRVLPVTAEAAQDGREQALAAIFLPPRHGTVDEIAGQIRNCLGLTASEARVAALVAAGRNPRDIAKLLNLSINTIRSHLSRIYSKTGSRDLTAVCSFINRLVPPLAAAYDRHTNVLCLKPVVPEGSASRRNGERVL
jgi:DNA-binding CsgD family transcriptional regulator